MDAFIDVFTSGDLMKMATFLISFVIVSFVLLSIMVIAKKYGITFTLKNKDGSGFDNNAHQPLPSNKEEKLNPSEKPLTKKDLQEILKNNPSLNLMNQNIERGVEEIDKSPEFIDQNLSKIENQSNMTWETLQKITLTKTIEEKEVIISSLEKENKKLKGELITLNKELIEYKVLDDPLLIEYRNLHVKLKDIYLKAIKKICLDPKLKLLKNNVDVLKYSKSRLRFILINLGKIITQHLLSDTQIFENENKFAELIENETLLENFSDFIKKISIIGNNVNEMLKTRRTNIDKKILGAYNHLIQERWKENLDPKNPKSLDRIKQMRNSYEFYTENIWNFEEIHSLIYNIGTQMIVTYEQVKSESLDKQILISEQFFSTLEYSISLYLKSYVLKKAKNEDLDSVSLANTLFKK